ncbi:MAG: adenylate/guanylate cyclase domain-containing protein [Novosphingobium sp.]|nr:adenylate/guanylate cyclase domain-containing protein [Novosphingobium sp.]
MTNIVGRFFARFIQSFPDAAMELDYLTEQRGRQAKFTRALCLIIGIAILVFVLSSFVFLGGDALKTVGYAQIYFIPILFGYAWAVGRKSYVTNKWVDVLIFMLIQPGMYITNVQMVQSGQNGWDFSAQFCYSLLLVMAIGCLAFSASVASYLALVVLSVGYYYGLLVWHEVPGSIIGYSLNSYITFVAVLFYVNWAIDDKARRVFKLTRDLDIEKAKSDALLESALPAAIAERLRRNEQVSDAHEHVAIVFADIVGFTRISKALGSKGTVDMLNAFFARADHGCALFGMEKVKTIGDCYMAVSGALTKPPRPEKAAVDFSVFLVREAHRVGEQLGIDLKVRIGINTGEMIGGVIGNMRLSYDYWGDTINVAARLQGLAEPDGITVSEAIWRATKDSYPYDPPRVAHLKNLGDSDVYDISLDQAAIA